MHAGYVRKLENKLKRVCDLLSEYQKAAYKYKQMALVLAEDTDPEAVAKARKELLDWEAAFFAAGDEE